MTFMEANTASFKQQLEMISLSHHLKECQTNKQILKFENYYYCGFEGWTDYQNQCWLYSSSFQ